MSNPTRQVNKHKGEAILKAATALFLKDGFEKTSMDAIAVKARVTKQTVYSHYHSKDQLFIRMISDLCTRNVHPPSPASKTAKPFEKLLYEVGINVLDLITSPEGMAATRLVVAEAARYPKIARLYYENGTQRITSLLAEFLDQQNAQKTIAIPDTMSAAAYFFAMLKGQYFLRMTLGVPPIPSKKERDVHVREVVAIFIHLYAGAKPLHTKSKL
jgi:TetR/AcrR family transcriptional repressor of mexJK operon